MTEFWRVNDKEEAQATDINQILSRSRAAGVIEPVDWEIVDGHEIQFGPINYYLNETEQTKSSGNIDLGDLVDDTHPRKCIVYINSNNEYAVEAGEPERLQPNEITSQNFRFESYRPAPPSMSGVDGVEIIEVFLDAGSGLLSESAIRNRQLESKASFHEVTAQKLTGDIIVDGADVEHGGELADAEDVPTIADIREAINTDTDHDVNAEHDYFSGIHGDLTGVEEDQHHTRPTSTEARNWVRGSVEVDDLLGNNGQAGQGLFSDGSDLYFDYPPETQAPVLTSGTITHTGPSTTQTISGFSTDLGEFVHFTAAIDKDTATYTGSYENLKVTDDAYWDGTEHVVDVTIEWNPDDPSGGDTIPIDYEIYSLTASAVTGKWSDSKTIDAIAGSTISPGQVSASNRFEGPVIDNLIDYPSPSVGCMAVASGDGADDFGQYVYSGNQWTGPFGAGVSALSGLAIDVDKDFGGHQIRNLGEAINDAHAARRIDVFDWMDERTIGRRSFEITTGGYTQIAKISNGLANETGSITGKLYDAGDRNNSSTRTINFTVNCSQSSYGFNISIDGTSSAQSELVLSETNGTGTNGHNEYYLYVDSQNINVLADESKIVCEIGERFGNFSLQRNATVNGTIVATTSDGASGTNIYNTLDVNKVNGGELYDNGNRVSTSDTQLSKQDVLKRVDGEYRSVSIPATRLEAGEEIDTWFRAFNGETLRVTSIDWLNDSGFSPNGGYVDVLNDNATIYSSNIVQRGTYENPVLTHAIGDTSRMRFRIRNNTGSTQVVSGQMTYHLEI